MLYNVYVCKRNFKRTLVRQITSVIIYKLPTLKHVAVLAPIYTCFLHINIMELKKIGHRNLNTGTTLLS